MKKWTKQIKFKVPDEIYDELETQKGKRKWYLWFLEDVYPKITTNKSKGKTPYKPSDEEIPPPEDPNVYGY